MPFFERLDTLCDFKVSTMEELLRATFENLEGENAGLGHPEWWNSGGKASFLNSGALNAIAAEMSKALRRSNQSKNIEY